MLIKKIKEYIDNKIDDKATKMVEELIEKTSCEVFKKGPYYSTRYSATVEVPFGEFENIYIGNYLKRDLKNY